MRVKSVTVKNFAGLGDLEVTGLDERNEVVIGGRNGIGKSQLLTCIALASRSDVDMWEARKFIGPLSDMAEICVQFSINDAERLVLNKAVASSGGGEIVAEATLVARVQISAAASPTHSWGTPEFPDLLTSLLENPAMRDELPFMQVLYLPADRSVARTPDLSFSLTSLSRERVYEMGQQTLTAQISDWNTSHTFDVFSSLAALHYAGLLEGDDGGGRLRDFREISDSFYRATGKRIEEPRVMPNGSIDLQVTVPGGHKHSINTLSSGELIALQLLHFVKLHYLQGSILLVDEPEQHLHPSLQVEIATAVGGGVGDGQLWLVTHSPNIIQAVPDANTLVLSRPRGEFQVSSKWAESTQARMGLLHELGVAPGLWVPGNYVLIVEGHTDQAYLRKLIPEQVASAFFVVAGTNSSARTLVEKLGENPAIPYLAVVDRDRRPVEEVERWNASRYRFMWSGYAIESIFIDEEMILDTLSDIGYASVTRNKIHDSLKKSVEDQREPVRRMWFMEEIRRRVPSRDDHKVDVSQNLSQSLLVAEERNAYLSENASLLQDEFNRIWESDSISLVDPKRVLNGFRVGPFLQSGDLVNAMIAYLRREPEAEPLELRRLRGKISALGLSSR